VKGLDIIRRIYSGYGADEGNGEGTDGKGPKQGRIARQGNAYLENKFPLLSYISRATLE
jgi:hypothetical protein